MSLHIFIRLNHPIGCDLDMFNILVCPSSTWYVVYEDKHLLRLSTQHSTDQTPSRGLGHLLLLITLFSLSHRDTFIHLINLQPRHSLSSIWFNWMSPLKEILGSVERSFQFNFQAKYVILVVHTAVRLVSQSMQKYDRYFCRKARFVLWVWISYPASTVTMSPLSTKRFIICTMTKVTLTSILLYFRLGRCRSNNLEECVLSHAEESSALRFLKH